MADHAAGVSLSHHSAPNAAHIPATQQDKDDSNGVTTQFSACPEQSSTKYPSNYFYQRNKWVEHWEEEERRWQHTIRHSTRAIDWTRIRRDSSIEMALYSLDMLLRDEPPADLLNKFHIKLWLHNESNGSYQRAGCGALKNLVFDHGFIEIPPPSGGYKEQVEAARQVLKLWATGVLGYLALQQHVTEQFLGLVIVADSTLVRVLKMFELPTKDTPLQQRFSNGDNLGGKALGDKKRGYVEVS